MRFNEIMWVLRCGALRVGGAHKSSNGVVHANCSRTLFNSGFLRELETVANWCAQYVKFCILLFVRDLCCRVSIISHSGMPIYNVLQQNRLQCLCGMDWTGVTFTPPFGLFNHKCSRVSDTCALHCYALNILDDGWVAAICCLQSHSLRADLIVRRLFVVG